MLFFSLYRNGGTKNSQFSKVPILSSPKNGLLKTNHFSFRRSGIMKRENNKYNYYDK